MSEMEMKIGNDYYYALSVDKDKNLYIMRFLREASGILTFEYFQHGARYEWGCKREQVQDHLKETGFEAFLVAWGYR
jgi:hypothetical protein